MLTRRGGGPSHTARVQRGRGRERRRGRGRLGKQRTRTKTQLCGYQGDRSIGSAFGTTRASTSLKLYVNRGFLLDGFPVLLPAASLIVLVLVVVLVLGLW